MAPRPPVAPALSLVLFAASGPARTRRSLAALAPDRQRGATVDHYEILVIAASASLPDPLPPHAVLVPTAPDVPLASLRVALAVARAPFVGVFDDAPVVTPRVVELARAAARVSPEALVVIPAYAADAADLDAPTSDDLYRAVGDCPFDPVNEHGYLAGPVESDVFFCSKGTLEAALDEGRSGKSRDVRSLFGKLLFSLEARLVVLAGEGALRPPSALRETRLVYRVPRREALLFGPIPGPALPSLDRALVNGAIYGAVSRDAGRPEWPLDVPRDAVLAGAEPAAPRLSIVLVAYSLGHQLENTLHSLSAQHQKNVREDDYEIIVVENRSDAPFGEGRARAAGRNVRYFLRDEPGKSPAPSMNFGVRQARGRMVGLMIDAARMVTPRVVEQVLLADRLHERPIVVVPGHHLGPGRQHVTSIAGYDEAEEERLLESVDWKASGYRLFEISVLDDATTSGVLCPLLESTCLFMPRACFDEVSGYDERFDLEGGGDVNLDLFARLCRLPATRYVVLWGEGNFHQYHRGVSTRGGDDRDAKLAAFRDQHDAIRGRRYATHEREPWLLGLLGGAAHLHHRNVVALAKVRYGLTVEEGRAEWPNG